MVNNMNLLKTISLPELTNWSVRYLLDFTFNYNEDFELVSIGEFLTRNRNIINIQDEITYSRVTVSGNNNGVRLRDTEIGKNIGTKKQYLVNSGQFIISKIDARNGALGIIPDDLEGAIVTNDFPTFFIDNTRINSQFLLLITTTKTFISFAQSCSSGTTNRQRINIEQFLNIKIPLPSLKEQNKIIAQYNKKITLAEKQKSKAIQLKNNIENYLFEILGIEKHKEKENTKGLQLVSFKEVNRWDLLFLIGNLPKLESSYPIEKFSSVITAFNKRENGVSIRINSKEFPNDDFHYIGMEHIEKETGNLLELNKVKGKDIKSQTLRVPKDYLLFGKLRPYLNKYWINDTKIDDIICSSEFFVFDISDSLNKLFFKYVLSSSFIQSQISDKTSGARMPRINEEIFFNLQFPVPPIQIQEKIAMSISNLKIEIKNLKRQAEENEKKAIIEFEEEIFKSV